MAITPVDIIIGKPSVAAFVANSPVQQDFTTPHALDFLKMRLTGTLTLAGFTTAPAQFTESLENLIASFNLAATGKTAGATTDLLSSVDAAFLRFKTRMMEGTDVTRTPISTANGAYAFETNWKKYFVDPRSDKGALTRLFAGTLSSLTATFQFRDPTAMVYGGVGGTAVLSGVQIVTQIRGYLNASMPTPSPYVRETQRTYTVNQSQDGFVCDRVPTGNILRRQYFKGMVGPTNYADPSNSIFGSQAKVEGPHTTFIINNTVPILDQVMPMLQDDNKSLFGVESVPAGYAIFEPARNKRLSKSLPMAGVDSAQNTFDVTYTPGSVNTIQITDENLVGVSVAQFNA